MGDGPLRSHCRSTLRPAVTSSRGRSQDHREAPNQLRNWKPSVNTKIGDATVKYIFLLEHKNMSFQSVAACQLPFMPRSNQF